MIGNVFFNKAGKIGELETDITISETHNMRSTVTDSPVEDGIDISDHIRNSPREIQIEAQISKTPVQPAHFNPLRYRRAFQKLEKLHKDRVPVDVITTLRVYKSMAITSIDVTRDRETGNVIRFTVTLRQIRIVQTGADTIVDASQDAIGPEADAGPQSGTPLS